MPVSTIFLHYDARTQEPHQGKHLIDLHCTKAMGRTLWASEAVLWKLRTYLQNSDKWELRHGEGWSEGVRKATKTALLDCYCMDFECKAKLTLSQELAGRIYRSWVDGPELFPVAKGHELDEGDKIIEDHDTFVIIEGSAFKKLVPEDSEADE